MPIGLLVRISPVALICSYCSLSALETPPKELLQKLSAESYPERISAQESLYEWSVEKGESGIDWLAQEGIESKDPETRVRSLEVLKQRVIDDLEGQRPGFVGIMMQSDVAKDGDATIPGVRVLKVTRDTPAEEAELKINDIIVSIDGTRIDTSNQTVVDAFAGKVGAMKPGTEVEFEIFRDGKSISKKLKLAPRPWSLGEYGSMRRDFQFRGNAPQFYRAPDEKSARDEVFEEWLESYRER